MSEAPMHAPLGLDASSPAMLVVLQPDGRDSVIPPPATFDPVREFRTLADIIEWEEAAAARDEMAARSAGIGDEHYLRNARWARQRAEVCRRAMGQTTETPP